MIKSILNNIQVGLKDLLGLTEILDILESNSLTHSELLSKVNILQSEILEIKKELSDIKAEDIKPSESSYFNYKNIILASTFIIIIIISVYSYGDFGNEVLEDKITTSILESIKKTNVTEIDSLTSAIYFESKAIQELNLKLNHDLLTKIAESDACIKRILTFSEKK